MHGETTDTRLARLEEAMVSVKGDTMYLRKNFDSFQKGYWLELAKMTGKVAGLSAVISVVIGTVTVAIAHAIWG